jgi:nucleoid DNA-binding protein
MMSRQSVGIEEFSKRCRLPVETVRAVFDTVVVMLEEGRAITIQNFGRFEPSFQEPRTVTSPALPGGQARAPRRRRIRFLISPTLRQSWIME